MTCAWCREPLPEKPVVNHGMAYCSWLCRDKLEEMVSVGPIQPEEEDEDER